MPNGNEYRVPITEFGADPRDHLAAGLLANVWGRLQGLRTHPYGPAQKDPSWTFNGYAEPPQHFRGIQSPLGSGTAYRNGANAMLDTGLIEGPMGDPARRIFAARMARRSPMGGV